MADNGTASQYEDVFEDGVAPPQTIHRIRANSTIMQLNKILGAFALYCSGAPSRI